MFVIFGWEKTIKPIESVLTTHCYHCNNHAGWSIWKESEWLSLFFIRILPFLSKYYIRCDICGDAADLETSMAKKGLSSSKRTQELHDAFLKFIEEHQFEGLTEGQILYKKAQLGSTK